jgi:hypothetical protein
MMLTRRVFYVFNCVDTDPVDGYQYTEFTSIECEGGMCRCWVEGGVQMRLVYWSIPAIFLYIIGFPAYIFYIVTTYKNEIKEDQLLRAQNLGDTIAENPFAHHIRIRYHRIYYHFKPSKTYWFLNVIFRKFWICMVGVVLREQPGFQLSLTQLVLFGCFWLQQKHRPFMSTVERAAVVADHKAKAEEGVAVHRKIAERIKAIEKAKSMYHRQKALQKLDSYQASKGKKKVLEYFWDYNTVEAVLLSCAILICLAGVMFESDRFADQPDGQVSRHAWQRDIITYATILLVILSLIYYGTVFLSETGVLQVACLIALFADKKKARHRRQEKEAAEGTDTEVTLSSNPMMLKLQQNEDVQEANEKLAQMADAAAKLQQQLVKVKRDKQKNKRGSTVGRRNKRKKKGDNKRSKFGAKKTDFMDDTYEIELTPTTKGESTAKKRKLPRVQILK